MDQSRILSNSTLFNGNSSKYGLYVVSIFSSRLNSCFLHFSDWVIDKGTVQNTNGDLVLVLADANGGTRLSSTRYVHYGTITARRGFSFGRLNTF